MTKPWFLAVALLATGAVARAQEGAPPPKREALTPVRIQIVITKYQGEKKVSSLPYTLYCNANEKGTARLSSGFDVPVFTKVQEVPNVVFKTVGTMISASAVELERGLYKLDLNVDQSSLYTPESGAGRPNSSDGWMVPTVPVLRSFRTAFNPILRDGQTAQHVAATDPISGEVVKVEVSVTAVR